MEKRVISFSPPDISELEIAEVAEALRSGWITTGPRTKLLERRLAAAIETGRNDINCDTQEAIEKYARPIYPDEPNAEEKKARRQDTSAKCYGFSGKLLEEFCTPEYTGRFGLSHEGKEIGCAEFSSNAGIVSATVDGLSGKHAIYFLIEGKYKGWGGHYMDGRNLFDFYGFVFQI